MRSIYAPGCKTVIHTYVSHATVNLLPAQASLYSYNQSWLSLYALQMHLNPTNTVFDAKRLIGRDFAEKAVQDDIVNMHWPFLVRPNEAGRPYFAGINQTNLKFPAPLLGTLALKQI